MSKRFIGYVILAMFCLVAGILSGYRIGSSVVTQTRDRMDYRKLENEIHDLNMRISTLERIGVEIFMLGDTPYRVVRKN